MAQFRNTSGDIETVSFDDFSQISPAEMWGQCQAENGGDIRAYAAASRESLEALRWGQIYEWDTEDDRDAFFGAVEECIIDELTELEME